MKYVLNKFLGISNHKGDIETFCFFRIHNNADYIPDGFWLQGLRCSPFSQTSQPCAVLRFVLKDRLRRFVFKQSFQFVYLSFLVCRLQAHIHITAERLIKSFLLSPSFCTLETTRKQILHRFLLHLILENFKNVYRAISILSQIGPF